MQIRSPLQSLTSRRPYLSLIKVPFDLKSSSRHLRFLCRQVSLLALMLLFASFLTACASRRKIIPAGEVPQVAPVSAYDEEYGQQVLEAITQESNLDNNSQRINRVRSIVDRLTWAANSDSAPWHVYVIDAPQIKNAGATRGNFVFVWSGILDAVQDDSELAAVLAHEIGHVLARHVMPDPGEMANKMISGVAGTVGRAVVVNQPGAISIAGGVAEALISTTVDALIVNPQSQRLEYEADQIGIFLMADAGYNPDSAIDFWSRAQSDPDFGGGSPQFLSSHPSSENRLSRLRKMLPEARERYQNSRLQQLRDGGDSFAIRPKANLWGQRLSAQKDSTKLPPGDSFSIDAPDGALTTSQRPEYHIAAPRRGPPSKTESRHSANPDETISNPTKLHRPNQSDKHPRMIAIFLHPDDRHPPVGYVREDGDLVANCQVNPEWLHVSGEQYGYAKSTELKIISNLPACL